jgi:hypothetical protein
MMRGPFIGAVLLCLSIASTFVAAMPAPAAANINGKPVSLATLKLLRGVVALHEPEKTMADVLSDVVQNQLLADFAERQYGDEQLFAGARVGFSPEVMAQDGAIATLRLAYRQPLEKALADSAAGARYVEQRHPLARPELAEALGVRQGTMRLDDSISPLLEEGLHKIVLLDYRFPKGDMQHVSLYDVWHRQNTQGRNALLALDTELAMRQAQQIVANRFIVDWVVREGGLTEKVPDELVRIMAERDRREALARWMGARPDLHFGSPYLKQLQDKVSPAEIARYYADNPGEFKHIDRVEARHMRFADEAAARAASERLTRGERFEDVARSVSIAPSREQGGYLGWIDADRAVAGDWLSELVLAWRPGPASQPVREPEGKDGKAGWQIVQVLRRAESLYPVESETVRYAAKQAIARRRAVQDFEALRDKLTKSARIEVDRKALGFGRSALKLKQEV